jgi:hypothetical protein
MKPFMSLNLSSVMAPWLTGAALLATGAMAQAQSFCASDGQPRPVQLMERFINADCSSCWSDPATPRAGDGQMALDWVVPGRAGEDAPLSAVASRDAQERLQALGRPEPTQASSQTQAVGRLKGVTLRVSHGLPLNDYLGTSIELKPIPASAKKQNWTAWLALVETLPAGTEGSPVERNLVRNVFQSPWSGHKKLLKTEQNRFFDARSMNIHPGAAPSRLRVMGWVENEQGQVMAAAQSRCVAD